MSERTDTYNGVKSSMVTKGKDKDQPTNLLPSGFPFLPKGVKGIPEHVKRGLKPGTEESKAIRSYINQHCVRIFAHSLIHFKRYTESIYTSMMKKNLTEDEREALFVASFAEILVYHCFNILNNDEGDAFLPVACLDTFLVKMLKGNRAFENDCVTVGIVPCYLRFVGGGCIDHFTVRVCVDRDGERFALMHLDPVSRLLDQQGLTVDCLEYRNNRPGDYDMELARDESARKSLIAWNLWKATKSRDSFFRMMFKSVDDLSRVGLSFMSSFLQKSQVALSMGVRDALDSLKRMDFTDVKTQMDNVVI